MCTRVLYNLRVFFLIFSILAGLNLGCKSSKPGTGPRPSQYKRTTYDVKIRSINDIQYTGAYKYDIDGKKYKKHYRKINRKKKKNE